MQSFCLRHALAKQAAGKVGAFLCPEELRGATQYQLRKSSSRQNSDDLKYYKVKQSVEVRTESANDNAGKKNQKPGMTEHMRINQGKFFTLKFRLIYL